MADAVMPSARTNVTSGLRSRLPVHPFSTSPGDLVRLPLAAGLLLVTVLVVQRGQLSAIERDVFRLVNDLPAMLIFVLWPVMQLGAMVAPAVASVVAAVSRQLRLSAGLLLAGYGAWATAQLVKQLVERGRPADFLGDLPREWTRGGPGFVSGHMAVATAMATIAAPYLPRPWRRVVWGLALLVGGARIYTGVHLPLDVVGGAAIGWFIGSLVHAGVGTPRREPTASKVEAMLTRFGVAVSHVQVADVAARSSRPFIAQAPDGARLFVKVLDPEPRETDWLLRLARVFVSREVRDVDALRSLGYQAEHEAAVTMAARAAGVRVPEVRLARPDGAGGVVVFPHVAGRDLTQVPVELLTDDVVRKVWQQVRLLHRARIAHRDLVRANVLLDEHSEPWLVDFGNAQAGATATAMDDDVAELMASLACAVGPVRSAALARMELGQAALHASLPGLQDLALSSATRRELRSHPGVLRALRLEAGGDRETPDVRPRPARLLAAAVAAVIGYALLATLVGWRQVATALTAVGWRWLGLAVVAGVLVFAAAAVVLVVSSGYRLAAGRTAAATATSEAVQATAGPLARRRYLVRYLSNHGVRSGAANSAVDTLLMLELLAPALAAVVAVTVLASMRSVSLSMSSTQVLLLGGAVVVAALGSVLRSARGDRRALRREHAGRALGRVAELGRDPARALGTAGAAAVELLADAAVLASALEAFGADQVFAVPASVLFVVTALLRTSGVSGVPAVEEALLTTGLILFGVAPAPALLGALTYGAFRWWVPMLSAAARAYVDRSRTAAIPSLRQGDAPRQGDPRRVPSSPP